MNNQSDVVLGSQYTKPQMWKVIRFGDRVVGGLTPGRKSSVKKKIDGNEDAMAVLPQSDGSLLLAVADSHFGALAANFSVAHLQRFFQNAPGDLSEKLFSTHFHLDHAIRHEKQTEEQKGKSDHPGCATTLITAHIKGDQICFCSTGDSQLAVLREGVPILRSDGHENLYLGDLYPNLWNYSEILKKFGVIDAVTTDPQMIRVMYLLTRIYHLIQNPISDLETLSKAIGEISATTGIPFPFRAEEMVKEHHPLNLRTPNMLPQWCRFQWRQGDLLFMATDGIEEDVSDCSETEVYHILNTTQGLEGRSETLLKRCLRRRGGGDNLTFVLAEHGCA